MGAGGKTALITGASSGIGYELAKLFARDRHNVVLVARSREKLAAVADELQQRYGVQAVALAADLARPDAPREIAEALRERGIVVDFLVNNAGFGLYGPFAQTDWTLERDMLQVNVVALTHLTKLLVPEMIQRRQGRILNVASMAAFQPGPLMAVYYATKAYVLSFSEALAAELDGTGVTVTALCPGPVHTNFAQRAGQDASKLLKWSFMLVDAPTVAEAGYRGMMAGKSLVVPGWPNKLLVQGQRLAPRKLVVRMVRKLQEPIDGPTSPFSGRSAPR
ncbi:MAG TPA: SDR family oxidoreductase [Calditerricola sp.]